MSRSVPPPSVPEQLLEQAEWLRRLARSLLGQTDGGAAADDAVQDVYEVALSHPPALDRPLRPWLAKVLRNLVRMRFRHEGVRARSAAGLSALDAPAPSPEDLLGRLERLCLLARLVAELDEPYRTTILLRFSDG